MNDFTKNKIAFAIALLATLFTISPVISSLGTLGFTIFKITLEIKHLFYFVSIFLALSVYFYGIQFLTERPLKYSQITADFLYAVAIVAPPLYLAVFLVIKTSNFLTPYINFNYLSVLSSYISGILAILSSGVIKNIIDVFRKREKKSTVENYENQELVFMDRARRFFNSEDYDVAVVECYKAIETSLRKSLYNTGIYPKNNYDLVKVALEKKIIPEEFNNVIQLIRMRRNLAAHNVEPISKEQALEVLNKTSVIIGSLASIQNDSLKDFSQNTSDKDTMAKKM